MNRHTRAAGGVWLALLAFAGLLVGHFMAYAAIAPDEGMRAAVLEATGHRGHGLFVPLAGAALLAALIGLVTGHLRCEPTDRAATPSGVRVTIVLWALQTGAFVVLEAVERLSSSHAVGELLHEPAFLVGLVFQAAIALAGAILVVILRATVAALCRYLARPRADVPAAPLRPSEVLIALRSLARSAWNLRGPPISTLT